MATKSNTISQPLNTQNGAEVPLSSELKNIVANDLTFDFKTTDDTPSSAISNGYNAHDISMLSLHSDIQIDQYKEITEAQNNEKTLKKYSLFEEIAQSPKT